MVVVGGGCENVTQRPRGRLVSDTRGSRIGRPIGYPWARLVCHRRTPHTARPWHRFYHLELKEHTLPHVCTAPREVCHHPPLRCYCYHWLKQGKRNRFATDHSETINGLDHELGCVNLLFNKSRKKLKKEKMANQVFKCNAFLMCEERL